VKVVSRYCDSCGIKIPASDIVDGTALKYEESFYCKDCKGEIIALVGKKGKNGSTPLAVARSLPASTAAPDAERRGFSPPRAPGAPPSSSTPAKGTRVPRLAPNSPAPGPAKRPAAPAKGAPGKPEGPAPKASAPARPAAPGGRPSFGSRPGLTKPGTTRPPLGRRTPPARARAGKGGDEGAEEEVDEAPPAGDFPVVPIAIGAIAVVALAAGGWLFFFRGNKGSSGAAARSAIAAKSPSEEAAEKNRAIFAEAEAAKAKADIVLAIKRAKDARERIVPAPNAEDIANAIDAISDELEAKLTAEAGKTFAETAEKARAAIDAGAFEEAIAAYRSFPEQYRTTAWWKNNALAEIARLEILLSAKREAEPILKKAEAYAAEKEWRLAIGVLEGFDRPYYREAADFCQKIERRIREYESLMAQAEQGKALATIEESEKAEKEAEARAEAERRKKEDERIAALPWEKVMGDDLINWRLPPPLPPEAWKIDKATRELSGKCGAALAGQDYGAVAGVGKSTWKDFAVQFRYKIVKGSFRVGLRVDPARGFAEATPDLQPDGQWHTIEIMVRGSGSKTEVSQGEGAARKPCPAKDLESSESGGVAFVLAAESEVVFADLKVKVIN
jgi:hypothetical protein